MYEYDIHELSQEPTAILHVDRLAPHYFHFLLPDLDSHPLLGYGEIHVINLVRCASY
jgi:hypothetical protein